MKKVLLTIGVANFKNTYIGNLKVATTEDLVPVIIKRLHEAGIIVREHTTAYLHADDANPACQASYLISEVIAEQSTLADYVKQSPDAGDVFKGIQNQN